MQVLLYYLADSKAGGWITYIRELATGFAKLNYKPIVISLVKKPTNKVKSLGPLKIIRITERQAIKLNKTNPWIIAAVAKDKESNSQAINLLREGGVLVHHAPGQCMPPEFFASLRSPIINIGVRVATTKKLQSLGQDGLTIPMPYVSKVSKEKRENIINRKKWGTLARIFHTKKTEIICKANEIANNKVEINGEEHRIYTYHSLNIQFPSWRDNYKGKFRQGTGLQKALTYNGIVDMTSFKDDGDSCQYVQLEAIDSGCANVLNEQFTTGVFTKDYWVHNENCLVAKDGEELATILDEDHDFRKLNENSLDKLSEYDSIKVAKQFLKLIT